MTSCQQSFLKLAVTILFVGVVCLLGVSLHMRKEIDDVKANGYINGESMREKRAAPTASPSQQQQVNFGAGAIYTRWGRSECPKTNTEKVYEGIVGGSYYTHVGGATNFLCLPKEPQWNKFTDLCENNQAYIYGTEFETSTNEFLEKTNTGNRKLQDNDAKCAVCRSRRRASQLMIPARRECPAGWTMEYEGYLMTSHYAHTSQREYICMDMAPEVDQKGYKSDNGALLYHVQAMCGALPCPDYVQGRELTCVVCTK